MVAVAAATRGLSDAPLGERLAVRLWVPNRPGMLAAVATRIAALGGNVLSLEVLEQSVEIAVDELIVELPRPGEAAILATKLQTIDGAGVEEVRVLPADAEERDLQVITAAMTLLETANTTATLAALCGFAGDLFGAKWSALVEVARRRCLQSTGDAPAVDWLVAFLAGARSAPASVGPGTSGSGVLAGELADSGIALFLGRPVAFRRREQRELEMLARVADRMCRPLRSERIPQAWRTGPWAGG